MKTSKNHVRKKMNWRDALPILFSIISLMISGISIYQSYKAQQSVQDETNRQYLAIAVPTYYLAESPDLKSDYDTKTLEDLCSRKSLLTTDYWRQAQSSTHNNETRYLFLIIKNQGPGTVKDFYFSELDWKPKDNIIAPDVLVGAKSVRSWLDKDECLALLVDVLNSYDESKKLANQPGIHFTDIALRGSYVDLLGNVYEPPHISILDEGLPALQLTK